MDINSMDRFLQAQEDRYTIALKEIRKGRKESHWMRDIFPQQRGLDKSQMAYTYGINGIEEARTYLAHPVLPARLIEITEALLTHKGKDIYDFIGDIDDMKLHSSMTLFVLISEEGSIFHQVLDCFYNSEMDERTLNLLRSQ